MTRLTTSVSARWPSTGGFAPRAQQRIRQFTQPETGEQTAEPRALGAQFGGRMGDGMIADGTRGRRGTGRSIEGVSLRHAEPFMQGLALPIGMIRARFNNDAAKKRSATMLTIP